MFCIQRESFKGVSGEEFELKEFSPSDLPAILSIEESASAFPWSKKNFSDSLSSTHLCIGVRLKTQWCAHAVFSIAAGEAELLILAVDPKFQGQKIAKKLLSIMEAQLKSVVSAIFLEVRISNHIAIALYESLGFNQVGERANYYPGPKGRESALIYAKHIHDDDFFESMST